MKKHLIVLLCLISASAWAGTASITIDASRRGPAINPRLYGIFLEEINHGVDGGLYAELVSNRAFEDSRPPEGCSLKGDRWKSAKGWDSEFNVRPGEIPHWSLVREKSARGGMKLETTGGLNEASPYCLRLDVEDAADGRIGVANDGFWGIGLAAQAEYDLSLHARGSGSLNVQLQDASGNACSDVATLEGVGAEWKEFRAKLKSTRAQANARLVITTATKGTLWLDMVSLFPCVTYKNRPNGLRPDLAQMLADLKPGFVRFPGGCVVEGGNVETGYNWKLSVGPLASRPERWASWNYRRTHGMGFYEYLQFCEDIGAEPLWVCFAGQSCLFRNADLVPMNQMDWVAQNLVDSFDFANAPADSRWGQERAKAGHPKPFRLKLVEIGNENGTPEFPKRYRQVHQALKSKYPDATCIADLSWISAEMMKGCGYDIADHHFYCSTQWFLDNVNLYDKYDRKNPGVYLGEVAVTSPDGGETKGNVLAALAEGAFMMGLERNGDVAKMVSYAPLLSHVSRHNGWHAMVYFDSTRAYATASYYLWKLFGTHIPSYSVRTDSEHKITARPAITGAIGVGAWDTSAEFKDIRIEKDGTTLYTSNFTADAKGWTPDGGRWTVADGVYRQNDKAVGLSYFGDEKWSDYTLSLKARKFKGDEGFLVAFGRKDGNQYWWNIGGWGNAEHGIEYNRSPVGIHAPGRIETNRWYDIKIELKGQQIRCFLDGKLIHDVTAPAADRFFALAGMDESKGELVVKAINVSAEPVQATLQVNGVSELASEGSLTVLHSNRPDDNNSMEQPTKIVPIDSRITNVGRQFTHEFPPYSLTILRVPAKVNQ